MKMGKGDSNYEKTLRILRNSKPELKGIESLEENIIRTIIRNKSGRIPQSIFPENLFSWIYVGWIRKSLVAASVMLVLFFIYQQSIILKEVKDIRNRTIVTGTNTMTSVNDDIGRQIRMLKLTGRRFLKEDLEISEEQIRNLLDSYKVLQERYGELNKIIEENPELKSYFEKKLSESNNNKPNL